MKRKAIINNAQKALLHKAISSLGMDDATYRAMLESVAGVKSSTALDLAGFREVMEHLKRCGFEKPHSDHEFTGYVTALKKWQFACGQRRGMASPAQLARIETDWDLMRWYWVQPDGFGNKELALRGFLKRIGGTEDLRFLTFAQAGKCIEALKAIAARREK